MLNFVPEKVFLRGVLLYYFKMKKTAAEIHHILVEVFGEHALAERTCQKWFARFKSGDFGLQDEERPVQPKKFEHEELKALLDEDCCQTQEEHIRIRYQKLAWFILGRQFGAVLLGWNPQIARKMEKSHSFRWAILWIILLYMFFLKNSGLHVSDFLEISRIDKQT